MKKDNNELKELKSIDLWLAINTIATILTAIATLALALFRK